MISVAIEFVSDSALHGTVYRTLQTWHLMKTQLKKGTLDMCVLAVLARGDSYAYELVSTLAETMEISEGTIYPLMRRMQNDGLVSTYLVESASGPSRKYYKITRSGAAALKAQQADWIAFEAAVRKILGDAA